MITEIWANHQIRFVENNNEWWAVAKDITDALGLKQSTRALNRIKDGVTTSKVIDRLGRNQEVNIIDEKNIYKLTFTSRKPEAEAFQDWVFSVLKELRQSSGLEGFEIFRMLDKHHQTDMMSNLQQGLKEAKKLDYIKANTITNKAVSTCMDTLRALKKPI